MTLYDPEHSLCVVFVVVVSANLLHCNERNGKRRCFGFWLIQSKCIEYYRLFFVIVCGCIEYS